MNIHKKTFLTEFRKSVNKSIWGDRCAWSSKRMVNKGQWDVKAHRPELEFATTLDQIQYEFIFG